MAREKEWSTFPQLKDDLLMGQPDRKYFYYPTECRGQSRALLMAERRGLLSLVGGPFRGKTILNLSPVPSWAFEYDQQ